jgi:hypothetical protein
MDFPKYGLLILDLDLWNRESSRNGLWMKYRYLLDQEMIIFHYISGSNIQRELENPLLYSTPIGNDLTL